MIVYQGHISRLVRPKNCIYFALVSLSGDLSRTMFAGIILKNFCPLSPLRYNITNQRQKWNYK